MYNLLIMISIFCMSSASVVFSQEATIQPPDNGGMVLKRIAGEKIIFAHQSVGQNIIDGIHSINEKSRTVKLNIKETRDESDFNGPIFAHTRIGRNQDPLSKIDDFKQLITRDIKGKVDIAFLKLCFVDINRETENVEDIFNYYVKTLDSLKTKFPNITFIHFTVPLTKLQRGPKALIKKILGKPVGGYLENIKRQEYNQLIRQHFSGKEPVFDIALFESTREDGTRETYQTKSGEYPAMVPGYTNDGGHLNEKARRVIARNLLDLIGKIK